MEGSSQSEDEVNATPKSIRNFKLLLDSDSEEDFTTTKPSNPEIEISSPNEPLNNGTNDSSDSENCSPVKTSEIKNRRKNSNPKKKIVVQRVWFNYFINAYFTNILFLEISSKSYGCDQTKNVSQAA